MIFVEMAAVEPPYSVMLCRVNAPTDVLGTRWHLQAVGSLLVSVRR